MVVMKKFEFSKIGEYLGTRQLDAAAQKQLLPLIGGDEKVILDFTNVKVVSNSFADECLAKLLLIMPFDELKSHTTFVGLNPLAKRNIVIVFRRRLKSLKAETVG